MNTTWFHLFEVSKIIKLTVAESRKVVVQAGVGAAAKGDFCLMDIKFQYCKMKKLWSSAVPHSVYC